jgi:hypothetical protein
MKSKKQNNPTQQESDKKDKSFLSKFGIIGGSVTIIIACIGAGFAFGIHYEKIELAAKIRELENQNQIQLIEYREKIIDIKEQYQKEIFDLKIENNKLQLTRYNNRNEK